jgi:phosphatidate cytidylyltransferase
MALNVAVFKTRALSALIFVAVMAAALFIHTYTFIAFFVLVIIGGTWEATKLNFLSNPITANENFKGSALAWIILFLTLLAQSFFYLTNFEAITIKWYAAITIAAMFLLLLALIITKQHKIIIHEGKNPTILLYKLLIPISIGLLIYLRLQTHGLFFCCFIIFCMWINDTMAYLVGSFIGKTPFSKISPKKTWEGTIGGILLCTVLMGLVGNLFFNNNQWPSYHLYILAAIGAVVGTLGDLLESKVKRMANQKDSGNILPGHGGFLDRFDSLLLTVPFAFCYWWLFLK